MTVLTDMQFEINGLLTGTSTKYGLRSFSGLRDSAEIRTSDEPRAQQHGYWSGKDLLGKRSIIIGMQLQGTSNENLEALVDAIATATLISDNEFTVAYKLPGQVQRRFYARCRHRDIQGDYVEQASFLATCTISFDATDPRLYNDTPDSATTLRAAASGGMTFPITFNLTFSTVGLGGSVNLTNEGNFPAPWTATFTGPLMNPAIRHVASGNVLAFNNLTLIAGDTLVVNSINKSAILNGTSSQYSKIATAEWFDINPGANEVNFVADSGAGQLTFSFRDTWV